MAYYAIEAYANKNCIGRAGRLGLKHRAGKSFLITDTEGEANGCWDRYVNATAKEIESVFSALNADDLAPYYLNYIAGESNGVINTLDLITFFNYTFGYESKGKTESETLINDILNLLKKSQSIKVDKEALQAEFSESENDSLLP